MKKFDFIETNSDKAKDKNYYDFTKPIFSVKELKDLIADYSSEDKLSCTNRCRGPKCLSCNHKTKSLCDGSLSNRENEELRYLLDHLSPPKCKRCGNEFYRDDWRSSEFCSSTCENLYKKEKETEAQILREELMRRLHRESQ